MADVAVEQNETPVVEKEVVEVDAPKVVDEVESEVVENGNNAEETVAAEAVAESGENGVAKDETATEEVTSAEEVVAANGDSTEAASEAVKRKAVEETDAVVEAADEDLPTPEKKSKVEEVAANGTAEEVVA